MKSELALSVFKSQQQCRQVLKYSLPILNITAVQTVVFMRFESPDRMLALSTHPSWIDRLYKNKAWMQSTSIQKLLTHMSQVGFLCQVKLESHSPWSALLEAQQVKHCVLLAKKIDGYYCLWLYGMFNDLLSSKAALIEHIDSLKLFSNNFYRVSAATIRAIDAYPCWVNTKWLPKNNEDGCLEKLIDKTPLKSFSILYQQQLKTLTYNQALCLFHLSAGMTAKEIAKEVGLSPRTIEKHFDNLKLTFKVSQRKDLANIFKQSRECWL